MRVLTLVSHWAKMGTGKPIISIPDRSTVGYRLPIVKMANG